MQARRKLLSCTAAALGMAAGLMAGGSVLQIGKPEANAEAGAKNAALVVRGYACADADKTAIRATAEGVVHGERKSVALKLIPLGGQSTFAVTTQWPNEGRWVLAFVMTNPRFQTQSALVRVEDGAIDWAGITRMGHAPTKDDVEAALHTTAMAAR
jgi:hypothetical protein